MQRSNKQAMALLNNDSIELTPDERRQLTKIADIGTAAQTDKDKLERVGRPASRSHLQEREGAAVFTGENYKG